MLQVQTTQGNPSGKHGYNNFKGRSQAFSGLKGHNCVCTHYGMINHTIETYFLKHWFPPGFKGKDKIQSVATYSQLVVIVNNALETPSSAFPTLSFGFTQDKYNNILYLIQQSKLTS